MSITLKRNRVQCVCDVAAGPNEQFKDKKSGASPIIWDNADIELAFAFYFGDELIDISNFASVTLTAKNNTGGALLLPERTITFTPVGDGVLDPSLDATSWEANTKQHALFPFTATEMNILSTTDEVDMWVVLTAVTTDGAEWILGYAIVKVKDSKRVVADAPPVNDPNYLTQDQVAALIAAQPTQHQSIQVWNAEQGRYVEFISVGAAGQESLAPQTGGA